MNDIPISDPMRRYIRWMDDNYVPTIDYWLDYWRGWSNLGKRVADDGDAEDQRERLRASIWQIRQLLRVAVEEGLDQDLMRGLNRIAERREEIERAFVVWIELIEVMVQEVEQRYGSEPGRGGLKADEVKEAFRQLFQDYRFDIPKVPQLFEPLVIDLIIGWIVDALVEVLNRNGMWTTLKSSPKGYAWFFALVMRFGRKVIWPLLEPVARLAIRIWQKTRIRPVLSPGIRAAIEGVKREGLLLKEKQLLDWLVGLIRWTAEHKKSLLALIDVILSAVQEAERFSELSGPEKKKFARDLVLAVLDNLGFTQRAGLLFAVIDSMLGGIIESAVHLFNKHGIFNHRSLLTE